MKYTVQAGKYVIKNFIYLFPFAFLPAIFLAISLDELAMNNVLKAFFGGNISSWSFYDLFCSISVLNFGSWKSIVSGIVGIIVLIPCVAFIMAILEKHFRIGKRTYNGLLAKLNDNLLSTTGCAILLLVIYEVWSLLTASVLFVTSLFPTTIAYVLAVVAFLVAHILLVYLIGTIYLWLPCMQITGFKPLEALQYSYQLASPVKWKIAFGQSLVLIFAEALTGLCALFVPSTVAIFLPTATFLYLVMIMVFCVRMQIAYFDRDAIDRADLAKYY